MNEPVQLEDSGKNDKSKVKKSDEEKEMESLLAQIEREKRAKKREERAKRKLLKEKRKKEREMKGDDESESDESSELSESIESSENKHSNIELGDDGEEKKSIQSDYIRSNDVVSAIAGTSKKGTGSVINARRTLRKIGEDDEKDEEEVETQLGSKIVKKKKKIYAKDSLEEENYYYAKNSSLYNDTDQGQKSMKNSEDFNLNDYMPDTITFFQDKHDENEPLNARSKLKKTALTVLLTQKWRSEVRQSFTNKSDDQKKSQLMSIRYQPTYRLESKTNIKSFHYKIEKKIRQTLEALCEKYEKYDAEYTPKFLRVITDLVKNDAKSFKLDRYKIVSHVSILTKMSNQDFYFISRTLFNKDLDHKMCLRCETKSFHVICLVFFVYCD